MSDFYEDDEPVEDVLAAFEAADKGLTEQHLPPGCRLVVPARTWTTGTTFEVQR